MFSVGSLTYDVTNSAAAKKLIRSGIFRFKQETSATFSATVTFANTLANWICFRLLSASVSMIFKMFLLDILHFE